MTRVIAPQNGVAFTLKKHERIKVIDPQGFQVSDLFCFNLNNYAEHLSSGRSIDYNDSIFLSVNSYLYSNQSQVMLKIIEDTCGKHDFLYTPCSLRMFQIVASNNAYRPSCHENLANAFVEYGISSDAIATTFNIFMNVSVARNGTIKIHRPLSKPGDYVIFEAAMDLLIGLTACSDEETNDFRFKPIHYEIFEAPCNLRAV